MRELRSHAMPASGAVPRLSLAPPPTGSSLFWQGADERVAPSRRLPASCKKITHSKTTAAGACDTK